MIRAASIGKRAAGILSQGLVTGQVLACFERVCDVITSHGQLLAVAWAGIPDGPLNILLEQTPAGQPRPGAHVRVARGILSACPSVGLCPFQVDLSPARIWDPGTDWQALAARRSRIAERVPLLADLLLCEAPQGSLAALLRGPAASRAQSPTTGADGAPATSRSYLAIAAGAILAARRAYQDRDTARLEAAMRALCGLGPGLTPAGDDWLAGWLLGLRIAQPATPLMADVACLVSSVASRTTTLSGALLRCAAEGDVDASWQALLDGLAAGTPEESIGAARAILGQGATSGADMLAGFVAALAPLDPESRVGQHERSPETAVTPGEGRDLRPQQARERNLV